MTDERGEERITQKEKKESSNKFEEGGWEEILLLRGGNSFAYVEGVVSC